MAPEFVGPYRIVQKLGSGGMGEVYLAEDSRLGRPVALKSLTEKWARVPDARRRLVHEARSAAGLNHPNVAAIYDVVETAEASWIVMEYALGESLATAVRRGPLTPEAVVWLGVQLCDALAAAHARNIIHRDLKPANLMLSPGGHLKVLDFGLAKSLDLDSGALVPSDSSNELSSGSLVGTLPYVPPEHILGERVDERSDLYSAGVVLYELLSGRRPYDGTDKKALAQAIVEGEPPDLQVLRPDASPELVRVVTRAMAREPSDRPPTAGALRAQLAGLSGAESGWKTMTDLQGPLGLRSGTSLARRARRRRMRKAMAATGALVVLTLGAYWASSVALKKPSSMISGRPPVVAVLPLSNASGDPAYDALVIGFADVIINALSGLPSVNVVSRSALLETGERAQKTSQLTRELGVDLFIEGSVQRSAKQVRIALSIARVGTSVVSWSRVFEGGASDMLDLQKKAAEAVAEAIQGGISAEDLARIERKLPANEEAFRRYGEARRLLDHADLHGNAQRAITLLEEALAKEKDFSLAAASLAEAHWARYAETKDPDDAEAARLAVERALALDPEQPQVLLSRAEHLENTGRVAEAIHELGRVLRLQPSSDDAHRELGRLLVGQARVEEGLAELDRALALRPRYWRNHYALGIAYMDLGRYKEAAASFGPVTELRPDSAQGYEALGVVQEAGGEREKAIASYRKAISLDPSPQAWSNLGTALYAERRYDDARDAFEAALRIDSKYAPAYRNLGDVFKHLGDRERAQRRYERAVALAEEAVALNPASAIDHAKLAVYQAKARRLPEALASIGRALELGPENVEIQYRKAVVCALAGQSSEAREALQRAIARGYSRALVAEDEDVAGLLPAPLSDKSASGPASRR